MACPHEMGGEIQNEVKIHTFEHRQTDRLAVYSAVKRSTLVGIIFVCNDSRDLSSG